MKKQHYRLLILTLIIIVPCIAEANFMLGGEWQQTQRTFSLGDERFEQQSGQGFTLFVGFELDNSLLVLRHSFDEASQEPNGPNPLFKKSESALEWVWNEKRDKNHYSFAILGLLTNTYEFGPEKNDYIGMTIGFGRTAYVSQNVFLTGDARYTFLYDSTTRTNRATNDNNRGFHGPQLKGAIGYLFATNPSIAIRLGARFTQIDFEGAYPDDKGVQLFLALRFYFAD